MNQLNIHSHSEREKKRKKLEVSRKTSFFLINIVLEASIKIQKTISEDPFFDNQRCYPGGISLIGFFSSYISAPSRIDNINCLIKELENLTSPEEINSIKIYNKLLKLIHSLTFTGFELYHKKEEMSAISKKIEIVKKKFIAKFQIDINNPNKIILSLDSSSIDQSLWNVKFQEISLDWTNAAEVINTLAILENQSEKDRKKTVLLHSLILKDILNIAKFQAFFLQDDESNRRHSRNYGLRKKTPEMRGQKVTMRYLTEATCQNVDLLIEEMNLKLLDILHKEQSVINSSSEMQAFLFALKKNADLFLAEITPVSTNTPNDQKQDRKRVKPAHCEKTNTYQKTAEELKAIISRYNYSKRDKIIEDLLSKCQQQSYSIKSNQLIQNLITLEKNIDLVKLKLFIFFTHYREHVGILIPNLRSKQFKKKTGRIEICFSKIPHIISAIEKIEKNEAFSEAEQTSLLHFFDTDTNPKDLNSDCFQLTPEKASPNRDNMIYGHKNVIEKIRELFFNSKYAKTSRKKHFLIISLLNNLNEQKYIINATQDKQGTFTLNISKDSIEFKIKSFIKGNDFFTLKIENIYAKDTDMIDLKRKNKFVKIAITEIKSLIFAMEKIEKQKELTNDDVSVLLKFFNTSDFKTLNPEDLTFSFSKNNKTKPSSPN